jgi:hypothetical protein
MSAFALAQLGVTTQNRAAVTRAKPGGKKRSSRAAAAASVSTSPDPGKAVLTAISTLASYIPTEGIAAYVAISALASASGSRAISWAAAVAAILINITVVATVYPVTARAHHQTVKPARLAKQIISTVVLTCAYVAALGDNPLHGITLEQTWAGAIALALAIVLPTVAPALGIVESKDHPAKKKKRATPKTPEPATAPIT